MSNTLHTCTYHVPYCLHFVLVASAKRTVSRIRDISGVCRSLSSLCSPDKPIYRIILMALLHTSLHILAPFYRHSHYTKPCLFPSPLLHVPHRMMTTFPKSSPSKDRALKPRPGFEARAISKFLSLLLSLSFSP